MAPEISTYIGKLANLARRLTGEKTGVPSAEWKQQALADFGRWIDGLPDAPPESLPLAPDACDLYTLLSEFTALRQEIKFQTRQQHTTLQGMEGAINVLTEAAKLFKERSLELAELEQRIRQASEKRAVQPFLDVRDALVRGLAAARESAGERRLFTRPPKNIQGIIEGYEMALRRFDRALGEAGIEVLDPLGQPFDPVYMKAVEQQTDPAQKPDTVLSVRRSGYICGQEVLRFAEVVVNRLETKGVDEAASEP